MNTHQITQATQATQATEIQAITALLKGLVEAWNRADGTGYGQHFTDDADYIDVTGRLTQGGAAIGQVHQFLFDGPLKGSKLEDAYSAPHVQFLAPNVALVISGGTSRLDGQTEAPADRQSINTTVLVKQGEQWKIRAFQNNRVMPMPTRPGFGPRS